MLKIAICDDDEIERSKTCDAIKSFSNKWTAYETTVSSFVRPEELLESVKQSGPCQIYLLDILMPDMNGVQLAQHLREYDKEACIIFLTYSTDFALDAYGVSAFQYLIRPFDKQRLFSVLQDAVDRLNLRSASSLSIKTRVGIEIVPYHRMAYLEYSNHMLIAHLTDCEQIKSVTMREPFDGVVKKLIKDSRFVRPHVSFLLNMDHVKTMTSRDFVMVTGEYVPISAKLYKDVKSCYIDFVLEKGGRM